jgi:4'-phosphopantetheinyl transferase
VNSNLQVWWGRTEQARPEHVELFDEVERRRWKRYRSESAQAQFTVGCAMVRLILAELTGSKPTELEIDRSCTRCAGPHGKPRLVGSDLHFSVSHSGERVGVAFAKGTRVGLDVERVVDMNRVRIAELVLAAEELASWRKLPEAERIYAFYTFWARKESVLKATGDGLSVPMAELRVSRPGETPRLLAYPGEVELSATMFDLHPGPSYAAALTVLGAAADPHIRDATPLLASVAPKPRV